MSLDVVENPCHVGNKVLCALCFIVVAQNSVVCRLGCTDEAFGMCKPVFLGEHHFVLTRSRCHRGDLAVAKAQQIEFAGTLLALCAQLFKQPGAFQQPFILRSI